MQINLDRNELQLIANALNEERIRLSSVNNVVQSDLSQFSDGRRTQIALHKDLVNKIRANIR
jgi:hypothetical protein